MNSLLKKISYDLKWFALLFVLGIGSFFVSGVGCIVFGCCMRWAMSICSNICYDAQTQCVCCVLIYFQSIFLSIIWPTIIRNDLNSIFSRPASLTGIESKNSDYETKSHLLLLCWICALEENHSCNVQLFHIKKTMRTRCTCKNNNNNKHQQTTTTIEK